MLLPERSRAIVEKRPLLSVGNPLASAREQAELVAENGLPCLVMVGDLPLLFESFEIAGQLLDRLAGLVNGQFQDMLMCGFPHG